MALNPLPNEQEILNKIANGCPIAFSQLFNAYYDHLAGFVFPLTNSIELTEDIIIDIFTKIWINRQSLVNVRKFNSYLFILVRNHTLNSIRKINAERKKQEIYVKTIGLFEEPLEIEDDYDLHELLDRAVSLLPPQQQKVFLMRQDGLKNPEIAKEMNLSPDSIKKYQQLAVKFVSDYVKAYAFISCILCSLMRS